MITREENLKPFPLNIAGSSTFGRYPKISIEKTYNMFVSDQWLVPYAGYKTAISNLGLQGRGIKTSINFKSLICVLDNNVFLVKLFFDQNLGRTFDKQIIPIGKLETSSGVVYIAENNKPEILISDGLALYSYDPSLSPSFITVPNNFVPGFIDFHNTCFLCAASQDNTYSPPANNTWRLSEPNNGRSWPSDAFHVGLLQTKSDKTQAVVRVPGKGNMVYVFGNTVVEPWYNSVQNTNQYFPYLRSTAYNIDYGTVNADTIASLDEIVVWLAINEKSGPIIMYTTGGSPQKITTDGIDYLFSHLSNPSDSQGFLYRQDGHLFYHINFYTDNLSLFYDFNEQKFYHASDENLNYFIANEVAFYNNQYYFLTKNNGNLYAFDTVYTTYDGAEIPRPRTCKNVRDVNQESFIAVNAGFTIETGETPSQKQDLGQIRLKTQDGKFLITQGSYIYLTTQDGKYLLTQDNRNIVLQQKDNTSFSYLALQQHAYTYTKPRVDMSISIDGGQSFGNSVPYELGELGHRRSKLQWWQLGWANDMVLQFKFVGMGRFVATDGVVNVK